MITDVDIRLAEELGFTYDCPEKTAKATLIALFRHDAVTRELEPLLKKMEEGLLEVGIAQRKALQVQQDVDVQAWSRYAAAQLATDNCSVVDAAKIADQMLVEQKKRFPSIL